MGGGQAGQVAIPLTSSPGAMPSPPSRTTTTVMAPPLMPLLGRAATLLPTTHHAGLDARLHCRMGSAALVVSTPLVDVPGMQPQVRQSACSYFAVVMLYVHLRCTFHGQMQGLVSIDYHLAMSSVSHHNCNLQQLLLENNMLLWSCYTSLHHCHPTC